MCVDARGPGSIPSASVKRRLTGRQWTRSGHAAGSVGALAAGRCVGGGRAGTPLLCPRGRFAATVLLTLPGFPDFSILDFFRAKVISSPDSGGGGVRRPWESGPACLEDGSGPVVRVGCWPWAELVTWRVQRCPLCPAMPVLTQGPLVQLGLWL